MKFGSVLCVFICAELLLLRGVVQGTVPIAERDALVALYLSTDGPNWANNDFWLDGDPCADSWWGVDCDYRDQHVDQLDLSENQLKGTIPPELVQLTALVWMWMGNNQLTGTIPSELGQVSALEWLWFNDNLFNSTIPTELGQLSSLTHLWMGNNQLTGRIPSELGQLPLDW
eukprot:CAMPEP_0119120656 /NCGR_PEP_ID=MMETSP1310-20130426/1604_1 /TAXON_ID=464262 /ORGANISM="Genus nov. species nov., Strain RCC2339" /LENGTH=171 /DNA_ID=CAMNT_0007110145 /DNA_START=64 /DNA_END=576 /DNA_ORIENTATION=+